MATGVSILKPLGYQRNNKCGYCKNETGSCSYYMSCDNMRVDHYQELVDRGWRRSGNTYYKPDLPRSCCPHYTIRLDAAAFKPRREQRQAIHRWNNFILGAEYKRKAAMLCPQSRQQKLDRRDKFDLLESVHVAEYNKVNKPIGKKSDKPIEPAHKFEINLEADSCTAEKHKLFVKYQTVIHKEPAWRSKRESFQRFLCSGLDRKVLKINGKTLKLGSYHQCYRLDGKLVAVAVLDLLPHAVSSVYLFYDPDYHEWDFGKMSAMREIALAIEGSFQPTHVLDPESHEWNLLNDDYRQLLDQRPYVSLSGDKRSCITTDAVKLSAAPEPTSTVDVKPKMPAERKLASEPEADDWELDSEPSDADDMEIPEGSLFDYNMPGTLTRDEVLELDLDHWKLLVRNVLVDLEDLRGWEQWKIDDPATIKGIAAELVAATGPQLLNNSALSLF